MTAVGKFRLVELDEDLRVCGEQDVSPECRAVPEIVPPPHIIGYRLISPTPLRYVDDVMINWLEHEEYPAYKKLHSSRHYLSMDITLKVATSTEYDVAWIRFPEVAIVPLLERLGLNSWGIGQGIVDRRGQDLFVVKLDGHDEVKWSLLMTLGAADTIADCWRQAKDVDDVMSGIRHTLLTPAKRPAQEEEDASNGLATTCYLCHVNDPNEVGFDPSVHL